VDLSTTLRNTLRILQEGCNEYSDQFPRTFVIHIQAIHIDNMSSDQAIQLLQLAYSQFNQPTRWFSFFNSLRDEGLKVFFRTELGCALQQLELYFDKPSSVLENQQKLTPSFDPLLLNKHRHYYLRVMRVMLGHEKPKQAADLICYLDSKRLFPDQEPRRNSNDLISRNDVTEICRGIAQCDEPEVMQNIIQQLYQQKVSNPVFNEPIAIRTTLFSLMRTSNSLTELNQLMRVIRRSMSYNDGKKLTQPQDIKLWTKYEEFNAIETQDRFNDVLQGDPDWFIHHPKLPDLVEVIHRLSLLPGLLATKFRLVENGTLEYGENASEETQLIINKFNQYQLVATPELPNSSFH